MQEPTNLITLSLKKTSFNKFAYNNLEKKQSEKIVILETNMD
jgi:hypothetical protein